MQILQSVRTHRPLVAAASSLVVVIALAGCSAPSTEAGTTSPPSEETVGYTTPRTMPEGKGSGETDGTFPRTVTHFQGETTIETEPQEVVVISTGQADALLSLGVVPAASTSGDGAEMIPDYLNASFPEQQDSLEDVTYVGSRTNPDIETIANLDPDLILVNNAGKDAQALYRNLSEIAPTVATQGTGLYWKQDFLLLADALGKTEQAQEWLEDYHADAQELGTTVEGEPAVSFLRKNGDRTRVFGVASFSGSVAEDAGLARPQDQQFTEETSVDISAEQLDRADGDWLFYGVQGGDETELTSLALWPTLGAVETDQAVSVDDDVFYLNTGPTAARETLATLDDALGN